jgi:Spy/CpxP family protein refolding chaperone
MKKKFLFIMLALCLLVTAASARDRRQGRPEPAPAPVPAPERVTTRDCLSQLDLSQEQIDAIIAIRQAAIEAFKAATTIEEARAIVEQMRIDIENVLTDDQLAALRECVRPDRPVTCMNQLDLTPDQIAAIDAIHDAAIAAVRQAQDPQEARAIIEQMHQDIEAVLTPEQLAALRECQRPRLRKNCLETIGLTQDQINLIEEIRAAALDLIAQAETREEIRAIMEQMQDDIMSILTEEQVTALQECRDQLRPRPRPQPGPRTER